MMTMSNGVLPVTERTAGIADSSIGIHKRDDGYQTVWLQYECGGASTGEAATTEHKYLPFTYNVSCPITIRI